MSEQAEVAEAEFPCYACLEESTHEIRVHSLLIPGRWMWLNVCDKHDRETHDERAAYEAGVPARGEI